MIIYLIIIHEELGGCCVYLLSINLINLSFNVILTCYLTGMNQKMNTCVNPPSIFIKNAYLSYDNTHLFENLNLTLCAGKLTCLLGPSGVGKSTLLRMLANLVSNNTLFHGEITCDNGLPLTQQTSYMAQTDLLMPWFTAFENTLLSGKLIGKVSSSLRSQAKDLLIKVGLKNDLNKYPHELSGGMQQRVALVRTLLQDKPIILMDEPFSFLDAITRYQLQTLTADLLRNKTVLFITHDPMEALRLADDIYILSGKPAKLNSHLHLTSPTPRDPADPELVKYHANLFHELIKAKETIS